MADPAPSLDPLPTPDGGAVHASAPGFHADDARSPLRGRDLLYLLGFYFITGTALTLAVATAAFIFFGLSPSELQDSPAARAPVMIVTQALLSLVTIAFLYALVRARSSAPFWPAVGWRPFRGAGGQFSFVVQYVFGGFALAVAVGLASRFLETPSTLPIEDMLSSRQNVLLLMALGILIAPLVEETIFRGCIYPVLARIFGVPAGIAATGALFGLAHAQQLWGGWGQIALLVCVGILLTWVRARAGTVVASYCVHLGYNTLLFTGFYFATNGLRNFPS